MSRASDLRDWLLDVSVGKDASEDVSPEDAEILLAGLPTGRESAEAKGRRLLAEGRLTIDRVNGDLVVATCKGDSGAEYRLGHDPTNGQWRCTCEAKGRCSHLVALQLVTTINRRR